MNGTETKSLVEALRILIGEDADVRQQVDAIKRRYLTAQKLYAIRRDLGLSQARFAEQLGVSKSAYMRMESGAPWTLTIPDIERMATALGLEFEYKLRVPRRAKAA